MTFPVALALLFFGLVPAAAAQESKPGGIEVSEVGTQPLSEYQVYDDGTLVIGGDVVVRCSELPRSTDLPSTVTQEDRAATERSHDEAVQVCTEAGFPPSVSLGAWIFGVPTGAKVLLAVVAGAVPLGLFGGLLVHRLVR